MLGSLCLGSVGNGLKFRTLGAATFTANSKKILVAQDMLYIAAERNSAFSHHFIHKSCLSTSQLKDILQECRTIEEWGSQAHQ